MTQREEGKHYFGYFIYNGIVMAKIYGDAHKQSKEHHEKPVQEFEITTEEADCSIAYLKQRYPYGEEKREGYFAPSTDPA